MSFLEDLRKVTVSPKEIENKQRIETMEKNNKVLRESINQVYTKIKEELFRRAKSGCYEDKNGTRSITFLYVVGTAVNNGHASITLVDEKYNEWISRITYTINEYGNIFIDRMKLKCKNDSISLESFLVAFTENSICPQAIWDWNRYCRVRKSWKSTTSVLKAPGRDGYIRVSQANTGIAFKVTVRL